MNIFEFDIDSSPNLQIRNSSAFEPYVKNESDGILSTVTITSFVSVVSNVPTISSEVLIPTETCNGTTETIQHILGLLNIFYHESLFYWNNEEIYDQIFSDFWEIAKHILYEFLSYIHRNINHPFFRPTFDQEKACRDERWE